MQQKLRGWLHVRRKIKGKESFFQTPNSVLQKHGLEPVKITLWLSQKCWLVSQTAGQVLYPPTENLLENQQPALNFLILDLLHKG